MSRPDTAQCLTTLGDGRVATVTATRRPRAGRADVKCAVPDAALAAHMQRVVRLARHTEPRLDSRDQVVISIDPVPASGERDWELAAVLADRRLRGVWDSPAPVHANGWSAQWQLGRVDGHDFAPQGAIAGGAGGLQFLGALTGQPDHGASVAAARAWFPLHSGGANDSLTFVEVSVYPVEQAGGEEEDSIAVPGLDAVTLQSVRRVLAGARHFDGRGVGRWRTVVRFAQPRFTGNSFELALVMADRLARGREFVPRARVIASGCSSAWHAGLVEAVEERAAKCALILREAVAGDRVLLPLAWEEGAGAQFAAALRAKGASVAWIDRIGII
ncbi:hypothetical protein KY495_22290 [Massilia sp. PAMC28688]|uniref:hypothetical protein n=1 Tax=Massilia sp. PAMC28688 TaxID=2861283 RepID=UPI001C6296D4|nr:hypothetical protein [Massilia sp. PAMC28688]QYF93366.1 hypothetical protein KY495_22290 [Massilia sp. PAMC28688]